MSLSLAIIAYDLPMRVPHFGNLFGFCSVCHSVCKNVALLPRPSRRSRLCNAHSERLAQSMDQDQTPQGGSTTQRCCPALGRVEALKQCPR